MKESFQGLFVSLLIAFSAFMLSYIHPSLEALAISIIFGMLVGNILKDSRTLQKGINLSLKIFLPVGIALYGSQLQLKDVEPVKVVYIFITFISVFSLVYIFTRLFGCRNNTSVLIATGMSVCGASAIAIVSPLIEADREETSISLIVVTIVGLIGMIFFPLIGYYLNYSVEEFALLSGTTLPMLGQVKVAAMDYRGDILTLAIKYKLIRMSFLIFIITVAIVLSGIKKKRFYVPWFVVVFILLAIVVNVFNLSYITGYLAPISRFSLCTALASIGLSVDFEAITERGFAPLLSTGVVFTSVFATFYILFTMI